MPVVKNVCYVYMFLIRLQDLFTLCEPSLKIYDISFLAIFSTFYRNFFRQFAILVYICAYISEDS